MGYVTAMGACIGCQQVFSFNPDLVPSIRMKDGRPDPTGERQPVCLSCMERVNRRRVKDGLPPHHIDPRAYEPADEYSIAWGDD